VIRLCLAGLDRGGHHPRGGRPQQDLAHPGEEPAARASLRHGIAEAAAEIKAGGDPDAGNDPIDGEFFDESWAEQDLRDAAAAMEG